MPVYAYKGFAAKDRKQRSGLIDAESVKAARLKLRKQDIYPTELAETVEKVQEAGRIGKALQFGGGVPPLEVSAMTRQLATLVNAQLPLVKCLSVLTEQVGNPRLRNVLAEVREAVNEGSSLGDAMASYPRVFSDLYVNMIRAGEQSGALDVVLERLADFTEKQADLRSKVLYAMLYPVIVLIIMSIVVVMMFVFVIPKISLLFEQTNQTLPLLTRSLIAVSEFVSGWGGLFLVALAVSGMVAFRLYVRTPAGREGWDSLKLMLPIVGNITRKLAISRFCKTLSTLLMSGIPLLKSLNIVEKVVNNQILANAISNAHENITEGASIADPLKASGVFPPFVIQMISAGEQAGELEFMLGKAADAFDREVDNAITGLTKVLEPIIILFLAGLVVIVILAFLIPILNLTQGLK